MTKCKCKCKLVLDKLHLSPVPLFLWVWTVYYLYVCLVSESEGLRLSYHSFNLPWLISIQLPWCRMHGLKMDLIHPHCRCVCTRRPPQHGFGLQCLTYLLVSGDSKYSLLPPPTWYCGRYSQKNSSSWDILIDRLNNSLCFVWIAVLTLTKPQLLSFCLAVGSCSCHWADFRICWTLWRCLKVAVFLASSPWIPFDCGLPRCLFLSRVSVLSFRAPSVSTIFVLFTDCLHCSNPNSKSVSWV